MAAPTPGDTPLYSDWFHTACIHIILLGVPVIRVDRNMQDFAKYRPVEAGELEASKADWELDPISMLFGVLLGAIVVFVWLKVSEYRELQSTTNQAINETVVEDTSSRFEFYTELKTDGLYPAFSE